MDQLSYTYQVLTDVIAPDINAIHKLSPFNYSIGEMVTLTMQGLQRRKILNPKKVDGVPITWINGVDITTVDYLYGVYYLAYSGTQLQIVNLDDLNGTPHSIRQEIITLNHQISDITSYQLDYEAGYRVVYAMIRTLSNGFILVAIRDDGSTFTVDRTNIPNIRMGNFARGSYQFPISAEDLQILDVRQNKYMIFDQLNRGSVVTLKPDWTISAIYLQFNRSASDILQILRISSDNLYILYQNKTQHWNGRDIVDIPIYSSTKSRSRGPLQSNTRKMRRMQEEAMIFDTNSLQLIRNQTSNLVY